MTAQLEQLGSSSELGELTLRLPSPCSGLVVTADAFWDLCVANPDLRLTRVAHGELLVMPPAGADSARRNCDLLGQLWAWNRSSRPGVAFDSSAGFTLPNGFIHAPDAAWIRQDRWDAIPRDRQERFAPICPDFVAELMSPSDRRVDVAAKLVEFIGQGARLGWLIDPIAGEAEIHRPGCEVETLSRPRTLSGEDVLPGFVLDLQEILFD